MNNVLLKLLLMLFILIITSCSKNGKDNNEPLSVDASEAQLFDKPNEISGFGQLTFFKKNAVPVLREGVVEKIYFREGDIVEEGEMLAQLNNPEIKLALGIAENEYTQSVAAYELAKIRLFEGERQAEAQVLSIKRAEADLQEKGKYGSEQERKFAIQNVLHDAGGLNDETIRGALFELSSQLKQLELSEIDLEIRKIGLRDKDLIEAGFSLKDNIEEKNKDLIKLSTSSLSLEVGAAKTNIEIAQKNLSQAREALSQLTIKSSSAGIIAARYFEEGEYIKKEDSIFTILNTDSLYAVMQVREADAFLIQKGMKALINIESTGALYNGEVDLVSPIADGNSFMFNVRILINEAEYAKNPHAKPGMFASINIILNKPSKIVAIDDDSIIYKNKNEGAVFIVQGENTTMKKITFGEMIDKKREIINGINVGDIIVRRPKANIKEGSYVQVSKI